MMEFFKKPFQVKYIPTLVALALGAAAAVITGSLFGLLVMGVLALFYTLTADHPLNKINYHGNIILSAMCIALAVRMVFVGALSAAAVAGCLAILPLSVVLCRKGPV